jgi:hypothetical protein
VDDDDDIDGPLWCIQSGRFFGRARAGYLFHRDGKCIGFLRGRIAARLTGEGFAEVRDGSWIGTRSSVVLPRFGGRVAHVGLANAPHADRAGRSLAGWSDPQL